MTSCEKLNTKILNMQEPIDELLEWLHTFDDLQFGCSHRNVIEKIWQIKSKQQFVIPVVVSTCCDNCNTKSNETITFCKDCYLKDSEQ